MFVRDVTRETFQAEILEVSRRQPVLVDFWGPRCGPCLQLMPWVQDLAVRFSDCVSIVKVNATEQKRLAMDLRVMGLPTFALFQDGVEVARLNGKACTPAGILELLERYADVQDCAEAA